MLPQAQIVPVYGRVTAFDRSISLIFDGYSDEATMMALADLLKEQKVETVFFVSGEKAMEHPAVIQYIADAGIPIGNYGLTGEKSMQLNKAKKNLRQFYLTQQAIKAAAMVTPEYIYCNQTEYSEEILKLAGLCGLKAAIQPNIFLNHRSFADQEQAYNFVRSVPRGSVITIKLGQELDSSEVYTKPVTNERPAEDQKAIIDDKAPKEEPKQQNNVDIVELTTWVIEACKAENHKIVSLEKLQEVTLGGMPEKDVPQEILEKLNISLYPNLITPEPFGIQEGPAVDDSYFDKAVFVGDSISVGIESYVNKMRKAQPGFFGEAQFLAAGGMSVRNALWQVSNESRHPTYKGQRMLLEDAIALMNVDKVYIMLGMNDILLSDLETYLNNYQVLIHLIREKSPGVEIFIQSISPGTNKEGLEPNNKQILTYNLGLIEFCEKYGYHYIDVASALRYEDGSLPLEMCSDPEGMGFHFADSACAEWVNYIRTHTP